MANKHGQGSHGESKHIESKHCESKHGESKHGESKHGESRHGECRHSESNHGESRHSESTQDGKKQSDTEHNIPGAPLTAARRTHAIAVALALTLSTVPFSEGLFGRGTLMWSDVLDQNVPYFRWVWSQILSGKSPLWTPNLFGGFSAIGSGQFAIFYPPNVLFAPYDPVWPHRLWIIAHLWGGALGMYLYSYRRFRSMPGSVVATIGFSLSAFHVNHLVHVGLFAAYSWVPWMFLGIDLVAKRWSSSRALIAALPLTMMALVGHPQCLWISCVGAGIYVLGTISAAHRPDRIRATMRVACSLGLGIGLAAVSLLPLWKFSRGSV